MQGKIFLHPGLDNVMIHFNKICLCIDSCNTKEQLESINNMIETFGLRWYKGFSTDCHEFQMVLYNKVSKKAINFIIKHEKDNNIS